MPRRQRGALGGYVYHVLNRAVARAEMFSKFGDPLAEPAATAAEWDTDLQRRCAGGGGGAVNTCRAGVPNLPTSPRLLPHSRVAFLSNGESAMTITIQVPGVLRPYCGGVSALSVSGPTVRAALAEIERTHPALHRCVCDETGAVRRHVNVFVNTAHMRDRDGLDTALVSGDTITILPAVSGG